MKTPFQVELLSAAQRDLKALETIRAEIVDALLELENEPNKGHELTQNLRDINSLEFTIKGSGQYRAAYIIQEDERLCTIIAIGPHENFYDLVARRIPQLQTLLKKVRQEKGKSLELKLQPKMPGKKGPAKRPKRPQDG